MKRPKWCKKGFRVNYIIIRRVVTVAKVHATASKRHREDLCLEDLLLLGRRRHGTTSRLSFRGLVQSTGDISHGLY